MTIQQEIITALARRDPAAPAAALRRLAHAGLDQLPLPGHGRTLQRWQALAAVAGQDLSVAKLYEGHTDALAIMAELGAPAAPAGSLWGTWCAEPPDAVLHLASRDGATILTGRKAWCSGARGLTHAVVSCRDGDGAPRLAAVALDSAGVTVTDEGWHAVGMAATGSVAVTFDDVPAIALGGARAYLDRPGFWHGGAGIAACWYGGAVALADRLHGALQGGQADGETVRLAQLGAVDVALCAAAALLRETAAAIDADPAADMQVPALRVRLAVEAAATEVLALAGRALGAGPLCREPQFARMAADLPVFLRQSHAERDQAAVGAALAARIPAPWTL